LSPTWGSSSFSLGKNRVVFGHHCFDLRCLYDWLYMYIYDCALLCIWKFIICMCIYFWGSSRFFCYSTFFTDVILHSWSTWWKESGTTH